MENTQPSGSQGASPSPDGKQMVHLSHGQELPAAQAHEFLSKGPSRVIVLAGASDSGKTTLIASLYERFQKGVYEDFIFAGSRTLIGFEKRCHLARVASGADAARTERTALTDEQYFLHLAVRETNLHSPTKHLLFTDISGEAFKLARDSAAECKKLSLVRRADHFVLCLDGEKLASAGNRSFTIEDGVLVTRSFQEAEMLGAFSMITVLITRFDLLKGKLNEKDHKDIQANIKARFSKEFQGRFGDLRFGAVSVKPLRTLESLRPHFRAWVDTTAFSRGDRPQSDFLEKGDPEFDQFAWKKPEGAK